MKKQLAGKIVVDVVAPVAFSKGRGASAMPVEEGSVALQAQAILADSPLLPPFRPSAPRTCLCRTGLSTPMWWVCADDPDAKEAVMKLAEKIKGVRAVNGGGLENARYVEDFVAFS